MVSCGPHFGHLHEKKREELEDYYLKQSPDEETSGASGVIANSVRATSFGRVAEDYDRYRPRLPKATLDWLLPAECRVALDLGAGTGAAACELVGTVERVIAVEPDPRMRALIIRHVPKAKVMDGCAESLPLEDASVDAVLVCSAWHWMDPGRAVPEIARVLRSGGVLGLLWNSLDRDAPWVAELRHLAGHPRFEEEPRRSRGPESVHLPEGAPFEAAQIHTIRWTWEITQEHLLGLMGTYSSVIMLSQPQRAEALAQVRNLVEARKPRHSEKILVPMACRCWKALRV